MSFVKFIKYKRNIKWICLVLVLIGYLVYFGFAMSITKPFQFPLNVSSDVLLKDFVFSNNRGFQFNHRII
jgi:hypothetical protein